MALTFENTDYDQIRAAVDLELTADNLPDAVIKNTVFEGAALDYVNSVLKPQTITDNPEKAKRAAILYCAGLIIPSLTHVVKEDIPGGTISYQNRDLLALAEARNAQAGAIIGQLQATENPPAQDAGNFHFFGVASASE